MISYFIYELRKNDRRELRTLAQFGFHQLLVLLAEIYYSITWEILDFVVVVSGKNKYFASLIKDVIFGVFQSPQTRNK